MSLGPMEIIIILLVGALLAGGALVVLVVVLIPLLTRSSGPSKVLRRDHELEDENERLREELDRLSREKDV